MRKRGFLKNKVDTAAGSARVHALDQHSSATPTVPHLCSSATAAPSSRRTASLRCNVGRKPYVRSGRASCSSPKADSEFKPSHAVTPAPAARCHASSFSRNTPRWLSSVYCRRVVHRGMVGVVREIPSNNTSLISFCALAWKILLNERLLYLLGLAEAAGVQEDFDQQTAPLLERRLLSKPSLIQHVSSLPIRS